MTMLDDARSGMEPEIRPQDDLFGHVNGRWLAEEEIPSDKASWGAASVLVEKAEAQVREIIEDCLNERIEATQLTSQIAALYVSFTDEERIERLGAAPIADDLSRIGVIDNHQDLAAFLGEFERRGGGGYFRSYVDTDDRASDRYVINLVQGGLGLPDESYYREAKHADIRAKYLGYLTTMFTLADIEEPAEQAEAVVGLETLLAEGHWDRASTRDVLKAYNLHSAAELRALCPALAWDTYTAALGAGEKAFAEVVVRQPSFFAHLSQVIEQAPIEQWRAWARAKVIRGAAAYLSSDFVEANFDFYARTLSGTPELRARWKRAVAFVEGCVGEGVGELYVQRHFPPTSKAAMDELVDNLLKAYRLSIGALDWMTEETQTRAYDKLATFRPKIGYPDTFRSYADLVVDANDLVGNARRAAALEHDRQLAKIGSPVDRDEWFMLPQTVNAYYNPGTNEICFPAGILQKPFFDADADPAENYGGIGAVIGHEIGHGFDDQGSEYDEHGNLNEWWTPADKTAFKERADALIAQYDSFSPRNLPDESVNGSLTVGENIGDLGGLTIGHKAYLISLNGHPIPERDGVTGSQRLFMSWAHVWRTKQRDELARQLLTVDPHSPAEFRANIVRNLDEFHEAFQTTESDGLWLEPTARVRIW